MRKQDPLKWVIFLSLLIISSGCLSSGSASKSNTYTTNKTENYDSKYWTLEDFLRRSSRVQLSGSGANMQVIVRGQNTINRRENQPLYIVDEQKAGRSFSRVSNMFSPGEIISVEVLSPSAASLYGMEGKFGVIKIQTKHAG